LLSNYPYNPLLKNDIKITLKIPGWEKKLISEPSESCVLDYAP
jgi:hypothetical protein